ncbi:hypothetical protein IWX90DRAFT_176026 [Phyllosticta citrichinensis]|uniref:Uncharacterized protein n=1 Tax=Phyllosticta citrichinensis TaxID=1130410 RepID=A0ABR1XVR9_9PEZI
MPFLPTFRRRACAVPLLPSILPSFTRCALSLPSPRHSASPHRRRRRRRRRRRSAQHRRPKDCCQTDRRRKKQRKQASEQESKAVRCPSRGLQSVCLCVRGWRVIVIVISVITTRRSVSLGLRQFGISRHLERAGCMRGVNNSVRVRSARGRIRWPPSHVGSALPQTSPQQRPSAPLCCARIKPRRAHLRASRLAPARCHAVQVELERVAEASVDPEAALCANGRDVAVLLVCEDVEKSDDTKPACLAPGRCSASCQLASSARPSCGARSSAARAGFRSGGCSPSGPNGVRQCQDGASG